MKKFLFPMLACAYLSILGCSGDSDMPCLSCNYSELPHVGSYCVIHHQNACVSGLTQSQCADMYYGDISNSCPSGYYQYNVTPSSSSGGGYQGTSSSSRQTGIVYPSSSSGGGYQGTSSSSRQSSVVYGNPVYYGGEVYETVVIGSQTWFKRNLNYNPVEGNSACYDCDEYGRLYDWETARTVCPSGWHLPSNEDWDKLMRYVDGTSGTGSPYDSPTAGRYLKAASGWYGNGNGEDTYGFSALPGGFGYDGDFIDAGNYGNWWSASEDDSDFAYCRSMYYSFEGALWDDTDKSYLFSVRCVQD